MAKIVIDCANPNDFAEVEKAVENAAGNCTITYAKQHLEMVDAGTSESIMESSRIIAKDSDVTPQAARRKIQRGLKEIAQGGQPGDKEAENDTENTEKYCEMKNYDNQKYVIPRMKELVGGGMSIKNAMEKIEIETGGKVTATRAMRAYQRCKKIIMGQKVKEKVSDGWLKRSKSIFYDAVMSELCKIKPNKKGGRNERPIIKAFSQQSNIPATVLGSWYLEIKDEREKALED